MPVLATLTTAPDMALIFRALAEPTRRRMYELLREGEACVCEMAGTLALAENLVSHHLGVFRKAGLVQSRTDPTDARWVYYRLDLDALASVYTHLGDLFDPQKVGTRTPICGPAALIMPTVARKTTQS